MNLGKNISPLNFCWEFAFMKYKKLYYFGIQILIMWTQQECIQISNHNLLMSEFFTTGIFWVSFLREAG